LAILIGFIDLIDDLLTAIVRLMVSSLREKNKIKVLRRKIRIFWQSAQMSIIDLTILLIDFSLILTLVGIISFHVVTLLLWSE
jgi:hypothetical protein